MFVPKLVIDGYNLLFQSPWVGKGRGRDWLAKARGRLMSRLDRGLPDDLLRTTQVVFDAPDQATPPADFISSSGLQVVFATDHPEADDLLEQIIRRHPTPKQLTVVSSDQRIQRCARARRALWLRAEDFVNQLERGPQAWQAEGEPPTSQPPETPDGLLSESEIAYWLDQFTPKNPPTPERPGKSP